MKHLRMLTLGAFVELIVIAVVAGTISELLVWAGVFGLWIFLLRILSAGFPNITVFLNANGLTLIWSLVLYAQLRLILRIDVATLLTFLFAVLYVGHYFGLFYLFASPAMQQRQFARVSQFLDRAPDFELSVVELLRIHARYFWPPPDESRDSSAE